MITYSPRQRNGKLTQAFCKSAGMGLSAADLAGLAGICTQAPITNRQQCTPWRKPFRSLHANIARTDHGIVVAVTVKSP
ncbi:MAG: hypothetical protein H7293_13350 [Candidatus Saccharibacteria bacterium]|nr:hypothetical protein [Rhodoferax sp.]